MGVRLPFVLSGMQLLIMPRHFEDMTMDLEQFQVCEFSIPSRDHAKHKPRVMLLVSPSLRMLREMPFQNYSAERRKSMINHSKHQGT
jgi:hypothetical protein